jgi:AraC family transcriptional regulator, chitin signaling transcriptional activator
MAEIGVRNLASDLKHLLFFILFFIFCESLAQNSSIESTPRFHGLPPVIHYSKKDFKGDPQFWAMCQDKNGVLYFANNDGALVFDGQTWQKVLLPNKSSIRSIIVSRDNTVYAGGFNEFGVIRKDAVGKYYYESSMNLLRAEERNIENIWQIHEVQDHIVFRSFKKLIAVSNNKAITFSTSSDFLVAGVVDDKYLVQDQEGLRWLDLKSTSFDVIADLQKFNKEEPVSIIPGFQKGEVLVITKQGSFFIIDPVSKKMELTQRFFGPGSNNLFTTAVKTSSGDYYIGTLRTKVIALSAFDKKLTQAQAFNALQDNTVHNLFESRDGKIWALLNNGIDCIDVKSPVSLMLDDASVYDVAVDNKKLFVATNQGVFVSDNRSATNVLTKQNFRNIAGLEGQAWSLGRFENQILCSHDKGIFVINENGTKKIAGVDGIWKVIAVNGKPHQYLACAYDGLYLLNYNGNSFEKQHKLEGFNESSRDIMQADEPGVFWICHGYKGVFKIKIDDGIKRVVGLEHFKDQNGLPSPFNNNVARWNGQIVFTTNQGIYSYDEGANKFIEQAELTELFGKELNVRKFFQHEDKTWFVHDNELGYFLHDSKNPTLQKDLFLQLKGTFNPSMECIIPISKNNVLIGTNSGLYAFDLDYEVGNEQISTLLTGVTYHESSSGDKIALNISPIGKIEMPRKSNYISFHYSTPGFRNKSNVQFSYLLEGVDKSWSEWTEVASKEYSSLRPGKYVFKVKSRSLLGEKGSETSYAFTILPAWYQAPISIVGFTTIGIIIIALVVVAVRRRIQHERHKTLAEESEKRRLLELEIERIKLASEKAKILKDKELLEEDVIYKSKELVNYTMLLVKKRELLSEMHEQLKGLKEIVKNDPSRQAVNDLIKKINLNLDSDEYIRVFEANFERVHQEFFNQLKANFPDLTPKELQLCAFVRMNLTNKEIAAILNLSVRGIETARYRLRKRLGMSQEQDMSQFLDKLHSSSTDHNPEVATLTA